MTVKDILFVCVLLLILIIANVLIFSDSENSTECNVKVLPKESSEKPTGKLLNNDAEFSIIVKKAERKLLLISGEKNIREFKIALGFNPIDDKKIEGDGCTPEGTFYICTKNPKSKFYLSLGISYPNIEQFLKVLLP